MAGIKTINKYTCADCKYHKCECVCKGGKRCCDGVCSYFNNIRSCPRKICLNFVLDKYVSMC